MSKNPQSFLVRFLYMIAICAACLTLSNCTVNPQVTEQAIGNQRIVYNDNGTIGTLYTITETSSGVVRHGRELRFSRLGALEWECYWVRGRKHGDIVSYHWNGEKRSITPVVEDEVSGVLILWDEKGVKLQEIEMLNSTENGKYLLWHTNGRPKIQGTCDFGLRHGKWTEWYENGQIKIDGIYSKGKKLSGWSEYDENGVLIMRLDHDEE